MPRVGNLAGPIATATFDHANRKAMQTNVKDMPLGSFEPSGHAPQFVMLFEQQDGVPRTSKRIGSGHAGQATADDNDIVLVAYSG